MAQSMCQYYFQLQKEYEMKYGPKTVVLCQVGSFYEAYEYDPERVISPGAPRDLSNVPFFPKEGIGRATEVAQILNMHLTSKNTKKPHSLENPFMVGFPCIAYEDHKRVLLDHDYTIVRVDQSKNLSKSKVKVDRAVAEIISPATHLDIVDEMDTNELVSIYIECQKYSPKCEECFLTVGLSGIDVGTGRTLVAETYSRKDDSVYALHETYRFLVTHRPREILITLNKFPQDQKDVYLNYFSRVLELDRYSKILLRFNEVKADYLKAAYQRQFFEFVFQMGDRRDAIIEDLELERHAYGRISFVILLQFCYEHDEKLIFRILKPEVTWLDDSKFLKLTHNAIVSLNLMPDISVRGTLRTRRDLGSLLTSQSKSKSKKVIDSLFTVVNMTSTGLGKRFLKYRLLTPLTSPDEIEASYKMIEELLTYPDILNQLDLQLKRFPDLERLQRKLTLGVIKPGELATLFRGYLQLVDITTLLISSQVLQKIYMSEETVDAFNECISKFLSLVNLDLLEKCRLFETRLEFEESYIYPGRDVTADTYQETLRQYQKELERISQHLNAQVGSKKPIVELEIAKRKKTDEGNDISIGLYTTEHKASLLKQKLIDVSLCGQLVFIGIKKDKVLITSEILKHYYSGIEIAQRSLENYLFEHYTSLVSTLGTQYNFFSEVNTFVASLDFIKSGAKAALKYKYHRPTIVPPEKSRSFLVVKELRHPIIEQILDKEYIPNDIELGQETQGILLYGFNGVGKCLDPDTPVLLFSGPTIRARDIRPGDMLMGDDSTPRRILSLVSGFDEMYLISPIHGDNFICTGDHVLVLRNMKNRTVEMTVKEYLRLSEKERDGLFLYSVPVEFPFRSITRDPYLLGRQCNVPENYKYNSKDIRRALLAGILDSVGESIPHRGFRILCPEKQLSQDIIYLARSLGYRAWADSFLYIEGNDFTDLPVRLVTLPELPPDREVQRKSFTVKPLGKREFVGFELDGNSRFLLGDFTVSHNSSIAKSVALNLILAQAGLYTAGKMTYSPYRQIITRLSGHDDIFKGQSSFVVEMSELRTILRNADSQTLVIADELCRGTESLSGSAIIIALLVELIKRETSFISSTHLHNLPETPYIQELLSKDSAKLKICHLSTYYDEALDTLVYERKLKDGPGESIYGLEVARFLGINEDFIAQTNLIRHTLKDATSELVNTKKSRYNSKLYLDRCFFCGSREQLSTHHLKHQSEADDQGFIGHMHKNILGNLIVLCQSCHSKLHSHQWNLSSKQTPTGLVYTYSNS